MGTVEEEVNPYVTMEVGSGQQTPKFGNHKIWEEQ
jgi:hypothetical protein